MNLESIVKEFNELNNWEDKYNKIIDLGKKLPKLPEESKQDHLKVKGCQSTVWLKAEVSNDSLVCYTGESDSIIVQGLLALLIKVYSGKKPQEILDTNLSFLKELGLEKHLSPNRANGVYSILKQILLYAQAFKALKK